MEKNNITVLLDGTLMTDRAAVHAHLKEALALPDYYGRNLDALYDLLTEPCEPTVITLKNSELMKAHLGSYASPLLTTLLDAEKANPNITVIII